MDESKLSMVTIVTYWVPVWLDQAVIEAFVRTVPEIIRVRRRVYSHSRQWYDLAFDFHAGTDVFKALNITESNPYIYIDHLELRFSLSLDGFEGSGIDIVSEPEPNLSSESTQDKTTANPPLSLKNLNAVKAECFVCRNDLDGPFSTPCWDCKVPQCHDCISQQFRTAVSDFQSFPARCCHHVMHPNVAKGILPDEELAKYKARFEEWLTKQPIYCPVPTCSTFIPPRLVRQSQNKTLNCPACQTSICLECKQKAHIGQPCGKDSEQEETIDLMKKFGYKQCPKCGTAVGKMFGCSHVQCACGAHWCWACQRKIDICGMSPCNRAADEFDEDADWNDRLSDIDSIAESDDIATSSGSLSERASSNTTLLDINAILMRGAEFHRRRIETYRPEGSGDPNLSEAMITDPALLGDDANRTSATFTSPQDTNAVPPAAQTSITDEELIQTLPFVPTNNDSNPEAEPVNLDDPRLDTWQNATYDFGPEPAEEDTLDLWGCVHSFGPVIHTRVPRYWMTASVPDWWERDLTDRKIECMVCWQPVRMEERTSEGEDKGKENASRDWKIARKCGVCNIIVCRRCRNELTKADA